MRAEPPSPSLRMGMFASRERWERKLSMLTQGALRQRRRRAMESVEERRERLARDAERKRIKRMSESAEEAAWRRTVDAMRKKEKRMKERETKAIMAQYGVPLDRIKAEVSSAYDPVLKVVRGQARKRRQRHSVSSVAGDYFLSFRHDVMGDATDFGGLHPPVAPLGDVIGRGLPSTSRAPYNSAAPCCSPVEGDVQVSKAHCVASGLWCLDAVAPILTTPPGGPHCVADVCGGGDATVSKTYLQGDTREDFLDSGADESLSVFSPEVIISEVKPEPSEEEEVGGEGGRGHRGQQDERIRSPSAALSVLSPEVIIHEVRVDVPCGIVGDNRSRLMPRVDDCGGSHQQLRPRNDFLMGV